MEINNSISEIYCSFEISKLLKEKEFDVPTLNYYYKGKIQTRLEMVTNRNMTQDVCSAPTHALAIEWIRQNFGIWISVDCKHYGNKEFWLCNLIPNIYNSPQEATDSAILYTLKNLMK